MAVTPRSWAGTAFSSSGGTATATPTLAKPDNIQLGDVLVATFSTNGGSVTRTSGSAWTLEASITLSNPRGYLWWKYADSADVAVANGGNLPGTWAISGTVGSSSAGVSAYTGVDQTTALAATTAVYSNATSTTTNFPVAITTTIANAMIVAAWVANTGELAHTIPAGTTEIYTLGSRHNTLVNAIQTTAGSQTYTYVLSSGRAGGGFALALNPAASSAAPTPTLNSRVVGTDGSVKIRTTNAVSVRLRASSDTAGTTNVSYSAAVTPDANGVSQPKLTTLPASTWYNYRVMMTNSDGIETADTESIVGEIITAPTGAVDFAWCFAACCNATDSASMAAIAARNDPLFFHLGDFWYYPSEPGPTTLGTYQSQFNSKVNVANHKLVFATTPTSMGPSDHDSSMTNNGNAGTNATALVNYNAAFRQYMPTPSDMPSTNGIYHAFTWADVQFIQLDCRSFATIPSATDNSSKTMLGATQKQWLKDTISASSMQIIVLLGDTSWIGSATSGDDSWMGYTTERAELGAYFAASGKSIAYLGGDMHAVAADSGTNAVGGIACFQAAPLNNNSSQKGGPYSSGIYPSSGTSVVQQYGRVAVTHSGTNVSLAFTGYSSDNTSRITQTTTYTVNRAGGWYAVIGNVEVAAIARAT
jgi:hypothetical protein